MTNITYYSGAGASANTIPVVAEFLNSIEVIKISLNSLLKESNTSAKVNLWPDFIRNNNEVVKKVIGEIEWLQKEAINHQTIDTLAKKFYLTDSPDLERLKQILLVVFALIETGSAPDKRYDSFIAAVSRKNNGKLVLPPNIKLLTWNYDNQLELSLKRYINKSIAEIKEQFHIYPNSTSRNLTNHNFINQNEFGAIKINGDVFWENSAPPSYSHPISLIDTFFDIDRHSKNEVVVSAILEQYYKQFIESSQGAQLCKYFNFAWERDPGFLNKYPGYSNNISEAGNIAINTEILVIVGYSFPVFNREIDSELIEMMSKLRKIYIQDINPSRIESTMRNAFKILQPPYTKQKPEIHFQLETNVDQFVIPYEL